MHIGTLNIIDGRGSRIQMVCNTLHRCKLDIAVLTETKLNGIHAVKSHGHDTQATKCQNQHQGGVALVSRRCKGWHLEGTKTFGPNVIKSTLVHDRRRSTIIGAHIPPSERDLSTLAYADEALKNESASKCILLGDLNANLHKPKDQRTHKIVEGILTHNFIDLSKKFISKKTKPFCWSWRKSREGFKV